MATHRTWYSATCQVLEVYCNVQALLDVVTWPLYVWEFLQSQADPLAAKRICLMQLAGPPKGVPADSSPKFASPCQPTGGAAVAALSRPDIPAPALAMPAEPTSNLSGGKAVSLASALNPSAPAHELLAHTKVELQLGPSLVGGGEVAPQKTTSSPRATAEFEPAVDNLRSMMKRGLWRRAELCEYYMLPVETKARDCLHSSRQQKVGRLCLNHSS